MPPILLCTTKLLEKLLKIDIWQTCKAEARRTEELSQRVIIAIVHVLRPQHLQTVRDPVQLLNNAFEGVLKVDPCSMIVLVQRSSQGYKS